MISLTFLLFLHCVSGYLSEPVLTPFRSAPIRNLITLSLRLTLISLYRFWYLRSGSARPVSSLYDLDFVVHFLCLPLRTLFRRLPRTRFGPSLDLFICLLSSRDLPRYVSHRTQFPLWTLVVHVPMSPSLPPSCFAYSFSRFTYNSFCPFAYVPLFHFRMSTSCSDS